MGARIAKKLARWAVTASSFSDLYPATHRAWTGSEFFLFGGTYPEKLMESETGGVYCVGPADGSEIFADGFESGDTSAWSVVVP